MCIDVLKSHDLTANIAVLNACLCFMIYFRHS